MSSAMARTDGPEFTIIYKDEQGELYFAGFESTHESGGMLRVPTVDEWASEIPNRRGQREKILNRLIDFTRNSAAFRYLEPSLTDIPFRRRWQKELAELARRSCLPLTAAQARALLRPRMTWVNAQRPDPAVRLVQYDRRFQVRVITAVSLFKCFLLRSDRTPAHPTRVEIEIFHVESGVLPDTLDGLTIDDVSPDGREGEPRHFRLRSPDGFDTRIVAKHCLFGEDAAGPEAPSMCPAAKL